MIVDHRFRWLRRIGLTLLTCFVVGPLYAISITAFIPTEDLARPFQWVPDRLSLAAFVEVWSTTPLAVYLGNSLIVSASSTALVLLISVPASYALARLRFRGRRLVIGTLAATQTVPGLVFLLPIALLVATLDRWASAAVLGSLPMLIAVSTTFALPFAVGLATAYFLTMPAEVEESSFTLGAGPVTTLVRVVLPAAKPLLTVLALFGFAVAWGEVLFTSVLSDADTRTVAVGLTEYSSEATALENQLMAAALIASIPLVLAFVLLRSSLTNPLRVTFGSSNRENHDHFVTANVG